MGNAGTAKNVDDKAGGPFQASTVSAVSLPNPDSPPTVGLTQRQLDSFIKRLAKTPSPEEREAITAEFEALPVKARAYIASTDEFHMWLLSEMAGAALGEKTMTKSQARAIQWFKTRGPFKGKDESASRARAKEGEIIEVGTEPA